MVHIRVFGVAGVQTGLDEGLLDGVPLARLGPPDRNRAVGAVEVVLDGLVVDVLVGLQLLEIGQDFVIRPGVVAQLGPAVKVLRHAADEDRAVQGA